MSAYVCDCVRVCGAGGNAVDDSTPTTSNRFFMRPKVLIWQSQSVVPDGVGIFRSAFLSWNMREQTNFQPKFQQQSDYL